MSDEEIIRSLSGSPKESSKRLVESKLKKGVKKQDNLTAVIMRVESQNQEISLTNKSNKYAVIALLVVVSLMALLFYSNKIDFSWTGLVDTDDQPIDNMVVAPLQTPPPPTPLPTTAR